MSFSEREIFIYHAATLMTMQHLQVLSKSDLQKNLKAVQNKRCTGLTDDQVEEIFFDVEYEALEMMRNAQEKLEKSCAKRQGYKKREFAEDIQEDFK
tara:strand:- start:438 stop:728 length:291 start_codon:yes stop_codon:yes gene_type:complete